MFYSSHDGTGPGRVLELLRSRGTGYVSGQDIGDALNVSGEAVRGRIRTLKSLGYEIQTKRGAGYRLAGGTDRPLPWEMTAGLGTKRIGKKSYYFDKIDSTQNRAVSMAESAGEDGTVIVAERQTRGRGRSRRRWESPDGGIWMSVITRPGIGGDALSLLPIAVAVALAGAIRKTTGIRARLKWPNDVTIGSKKVAGVIIDASVESGRLEYAVIGAGINFDVDVEKIERTLRGTPDRYGGVTSIRGHDCTANRLDLIRAFFAELERNLSRLESGRTGAIIKDWTRDSCTLGGRVSAHTGGGRITGVAQKIDRDGALIIKTRGGKAERILAEDITHLR